MVSTRPAGSAGRAAVAAACAALDVARRAARADVKYRDVLGRVVRLLRDIGPLTRRQLRDHAGRTGRLAAGDETVGAVVERAIAEGSLVVAGGKVAPPPPEGSAE